MQNALIEKGRSPRSGTKPPRGRPFTSETGLKARQRRTELAKERADLEEIRSCITAAFKRRMSETITLSNGQTMTGAEVIAESIIKGASNGNAKMVEIALAMMGETPRPEDEVYKHPVQIVIDV